ncbi:Class I peptide chain release factor [Pirellula staleyi DSM 6068]|uniref:Class I peptide chain release factor n=1 Tax=Pirellula staleyi (strain ATCC 27377 / DSM 6068 / ICPB 4128) TaxID=530564 RepID=D2R993_PIRSD|nr:alternative ribosome rescue aminoacyl-tRNA hydrolase ArfB [Pirellula staleyi]ADB17643.1 Class I peptide chain release factor [Pirellula staleyi DSM 6068]
MISVSSKITIPDAELHFTYSRAGGPGGQNVNKVSSKATMHFDVTASPSIPDDVKQRFLTTFKSRLTTEGQVVIHSQEHRDQPRNAEACEQKLKEMLLAVLTPPRKRRATKPTRGSQVRRLKEKKARSDIKRGRSGGRDE